MFAFNEVAFAGVYPGGLGWRTNDDDNDDEDDDNDDDDDDNYDDEDDDDNGNVKVLNTWPWFDTQSGQWA